MNEELIFILTCIAKDESDICYLKVDIPCFGIQCENCVFDIHTVPIKNKYVYKIISTKVHLL